jgi:hypothetical protein
MARYRVRAGCLLPHHGQILVGGAILELPPHVAEDNVIRDLVEAIDEAGNVLLATAVPHDFERFRPHEQVTLLEARLYEAVARVQTLRSQIAQAQAAMVADEPGVIAFTPNRSHLGPAAEE